MISESLVFTPPPLQESLSAQPRARKSENQPTTFGSLTLLSKAITSKSNTSQKKKWATLLPDVGGCEGKTELWCCSLVCPTTPILVTMVRDFPGGTRVAGTTGPRCDPPNLRQPTSLRSTHPTPTPCNPPKTYEKFFNKIYFIEYWSSQTEAADVSSIHPGSKPSYVLGFFSVAIFLSNRHRADCQFNEKYPLKIYFMMYLVTFLKLVMV